MEQPEGRASEWVRSVYDNADLVLRFVATFARFECALKAHPKYVKAITSKKTGKVVRVVGVAADWDRFADHLVGAFPPPDVLARAAAGTLEGDLRAAEKLFDSAPPEKQTFRNGRVGWEPLNVTREAREKRLLHYVRTVRNNLFHGGKYPTGPVSEATRDEALLTACLAILDTAERFPGLSERFREAA